MVSERKISHKHTTKRMNHMTINKKTVVKVSLGSVLGACIAGIVKYVAARRNHKSGVAA